MCRRLEESSEVLEQSPEGGKIIFKAVHAAQPYECPFVCDLQSEGSIPLMHKLTIYQTDCLHPFQFLDSNFSYIFLSVTMDNERTNKNLPVF